MEIQVSSSRLPHLHRPSSPLSSLPFTALRLFGFGAVNANGFGIGYIIKDDSIAFCAASKHRQTQRFLDALKAYFIEVHRMMKQLHAEANRKPNSVRFASRRLSHWAISAHLLHMYTQVFVDHFAGEVDARSGKPLSSHIRTGSNVGAQAEEEFGGYGFYGELSEVRGI